MPTWKHADVFPIIDRIIRQACADEADGSYISRQRIADRLLQDREARTIIENAHEGQADQTLGWIARNMVDFFSKAFNESPQKDKFDRIKIEDNWAYKLRN